MNQFYASFFSKIFDGTEHSAPNAILIKEKLVSFQEMVDSYKRNTNIFKNLTFDKFPQPNFTSIQSLLQNELTTTNENINLLIELQADILGGAI